MAAYTTIDDPEAYFQTVLYTGNGSTQSITLPGDTNMQPDMVWIKVRNNTFNHYIFDAPRGVNQYLKPNQGAAEADGDPDHLTAFDSDGFSLGGTAGVNYNTATFVAWCWKAGTTSGIGTSGQDITPSAYSINTTSKFGIYAYGGNGTDDSQINHGLGVAPKFIIQKVRSNGDQDWHVFHAKNTSAPETDYLYLNSTAATTDRVESWSDELPDTTDITLGTSNDGNQSGQTFIMYAWGEVQGFSKFGSYTGNGNADGTFVYTGFRPAYLLIKRTDATENWIIQDNKTSPYNPTHDFLQADSPSIPTAGGTPIDLLSNGFKPRTTSVYSNTSGGTYVYAAFAEAPFVNSNGVPCNAR